MTGVGTARVRGAEESAEPRRTRLSAVAALVGAGVAVAVQIGKAITALPTITGELGLSLTMSGWVLGAFTGFTAALGLVAGAGIDRVGHRRAVLTGLAVTALASILGAAVDGPGLLLATRVAEGAGFTLTVLGVPPLLVRATVAARRPLVLGVWSAFNPAGIAVGVLVGHWLLGPLGWRVVWVCAGVLTALVALLVALTTRGLGRSGTSPTHGFGSTVRAVVTSPAPLLLAGIFAAYAAQYLAVFGFLPTLLREQGGVSAGAASILTASAVAANIPGNVIGGMLRTRGVARWILICGASAVMVVAAVVIFADGWGLSVRFASAVLLSFVGGVIPATLMEAATVLAPRPGAVAGTVGLVNQGSGLGQTVGPPVVSALASAAGGWQFSAVPVAVAAAVAAALAVVLRRGGAER